MDVGVDLILVFIAKFATMIVVENLYVMFYFDFANNLHADH